MHSFFQKFKEPFPSSESPREHFIITLCISVFIAAFLFLFRPFGAENNAGEYFLVCLGFGFVTFFFMASFELVIPKIFRLEMDLPSWTLFKWIIYALTMICWIAFGNLAFIEITNPGRQMYWDAWLMTAIPQTLAIGIFPIVFYGLITQMRMANKNKEQAQKIEITAPEKSKSTINFTVASDAEMTLTEDELLYVQAMQNYVAVVHWDGEKIEKTLVRSTLQSLYQVIASQSDVVKRCHRSFLVNTQAVTAIEGNAQGLKLSLRHVDDFAVPVSRGFIDDLRSSIST